MEKKEIKPVIVKVKSGNTEDLNEAYLYLFDDEGQLIESVALRNGEAALRIKAEDIVGNTQIIIGPGLPKEFERIKLNPIFIKKIGGYQPSIHLNADNEIHIVGVPKFPIPFFEWCLIAGSLTKNFDIDGQNKELPVCDARVHICEVDRIRWWWWRIPPFVIEELGRKLKEIIINPELAFPHPIPEPDPSPLVRFANMGFSSERKMFKRRQTKKSIKTQAEIKVLSKASLSILPDHVKNGLLSPSSAIVSETINNNFHLLHPYICLWPWFWPYFYFCNDIATVYTDCNGRFNFEYLNISQDKDIYVWVEVCINGQWITVYRPSLACGTRWNYSCGSDIKISITDPRVLPCTCVQQLHGEIVWFRSIGESATALHIEQNDTNTVNIQGVNLPNVGCTDVVDAHRVSPFGSTLYFKLLFGDGLPTSGITHYRWRKTNIKDAALNNIFSPETTVVNGLVQKTYFVITTDILGHFHFETKAVILGAEGIGENIGYRIPHWDIYQDPGIPAADKLLTIQWTSPDFWSAILDSKSLSDGLWRFDLELLQLDGASTFQVVDVPKQVFQVSEYGNSGNSINAPNDYLKLNSGNPLKAFNFKVKARIDNEQCNADIQDASIVVNGVTEYSGPCGFLHYTDAVNQPVHISFIATHPRNFAIFNFGVVKGNNTTQISPSINQDGYVISSVGNYTLSGGIFFNDVTALQLIGSCPQAAFSENLHVVSLATDGTRRLNEYDDHDTNAFALSNT